MTSDYPTFFSKQHWEHKFVLMQCIVLEYHKISCRRKEREILVVSYKFNAHFYSTFGYQSQAHVSSLTANSRLTGSTFFASVLFTIYQPYDVSVNCCQIFDLLVNYYLLFYTARHLMFFFSTSTYFVNAKCYADVWFDR